MTSSPDSRRMNVALLLLCKERN